MSDKPKAGHMTLPNRFVGHLLRDFVDIRRGVGMDDADIQGQLEALTNHTKVPTTLLPAILKMAFKE